MDGYRHGILMHLESLGAAVAQLVASGGTSGAAGLSAYQIWQAAGNAGTQAEFLASLKGPKGDPGTPGSPGLPGSSSVVTVPVTDTVTTGTATGGIWAGAGTITDAAGAIWSIRLADRTVLKNGAAQPFTNVLQLWYADSAVFAFYGDRWEAISGVTFADRPKMPTTPGLRLPVGPQTLALPAGLTVNPGDNLQALTNANPAGTVFCLKKGTYNAQSVVPKAGNQYIGEHDGTTGVTLDGTSNTQYAFYINSGVSNVVIKNIFVKNYTAPTQTCAIMAVGPYALIANNDVSGGTLGGGIWGSIYSLVVSNKIHGNAQLGYKVVGNDTDGSTVCTGPCLDNNEIYGNNPTNAVWGGSEQGGGKAWNTSHLTCWYNYSHDNGGDGLWTDFNNIYTTYWYNRCENNRANGIEHEIGYNASILGNSLVGNGSTGSLNDFFSGAAIAINNSGGIDSGTYKGTIEIAYNTVTAGANGRLICFREQDRGTPTTPYTTNLWRCENTYVHHNAMTFGALADPQVGLARDHDLGTNIFALRKIKYDYNAYTFAGTPYFSWQDQPFNSFAQWQGLGQDVHGAVTP